ncbi:MAG: hypothetical protein OER86_02590, partial [Phycisphaerae bacterium]|nr:hypothetical protein [Phycisphaerae bacterium]
PQQRLRLPENDRQWTFARGVASVELQPAEDVRVEVFVVHLKSKRTVEDSDPQSATWRLSEALGLRRLIAERLRRNPGAYVAVMGDFNDTPLSPPMRTLLKVGPEGKALLVDPHEGLPADKRITYLKKPYRANVDYILLSSSLAKHVVPGSAEVYGHEPNGSDHAPVMLTLQLPTRQADAVKDWPSPHPAQPVKVKMRPRAPKPPTGKTKSPAAS